MEEPGWMATIWLAQMMTKESIDKLDHRGEDESIYDSIQLKLIFVFTFL